MSKAYFGLPEDVIFCKKCVISNQRPSSTVEFKHKPDEKKTTIGFGADGICDACKFQVTNESKINWEKRDEALGELAAKHKRSDGGYDVIVPGSGGKRNVYGVQFHPEKSGPIGLQIIANFAKAD